LEKNKKDYNDKEDHDDDRPRYFFQKNKKLKILKKKKNITMMTRAMSMINHKHYFRWI